MESQTGHPEFKSGLKLCWASLLLLPVGLLGVSGGPCAGPSGTPGAAILLAVGLGSLVAAVYGIALIIRNWNRSPGSMRIFGGLSVLGALGALVGAGVYVLIGILTFSAFVRY
jgi:hypothetical protein